MLVNTGSSLLLVQKIENYAKKKDEAALPPSESCHARDQEFGRRLSAEGAKPVSNNGGKSDLGHIRTYVGGWVCMVFGILSRTKARNAPNQVPKM